MSINVSSSTIRKIKQGVDAVGVINEANMLVMEMLDSQMKNNFECLLYPGSTSLSLSSVGTALLDSVVTRVHLQSIDIDFNSLNFESADTVKYVKEIVRPETCTFHFIENELAVMRNYIQMWKNEVYYAAPIYSYGYLFKNDQEASKKNAIVTPMMGTGIPSPGMIKLEGLKPKSQESITMGHGEGEPMIITLTCSVDKVDWITLTNLFI